MYCSNGFLYLETGNRKILVKVQHCGIDMHIMHDMLETKAFKSEYKQMKEVAGKRFAIGSTDRLSPLSGITQKLSGYKKFLAKFPEYKDKISLIQVCWLAQCVVHV